MLLRNLINGEVLLCVLFASTMSCELLALPLMCNLPRGVVFPTPTFCEYEFAAVTKQVTNRHVLNNDFIGSTLKTMDHSILWQFIQAYQF